MFLRILILLLLQATFSSPKTLSQYYKTLYLERLVDMWTRKHRHSQGFGYGHRTLAFVKNEDMDMVRAQKTI